MIRAVIALVAVAVAQFLVAVIIGWLANRRNASWVHVAAVSNTVILFSVLSTIDEFRHNGLTLYGVFYAMLMVWLASAGARYGTVGFRAVKANQIYRPSSEQQR